MLTRDWPVYTSQQHKIYLATHTQHFQLLEGMCEKRTLHGKQVTEDIEDIQGHTAQSKKKKKSK